MDSENQRGGARKRYVLQQIYVRSQKANVELNRKVLADIAVNDAQSFAKLVETAKASL